MFDRSSIDDDRTPTQDEKIDIAKEAEATLTRLYGPLEEDEDPDGP
jgi:hypothetical protein